MTDEERRDLDETRRLLYIALASPSTRRYNLVGTLANALRHHQSERLDRSIEETLSALIAVCEGDAEACVEAQELIEEITAKLDAPEVTPVAPALPPEVTNALAALDELLGACVDSTRHGDYYHPTLTAASVEWSRVRLSIVKAYVDQAGS